MPRPELDLYMNRITTLASEIQRHVPSTSTTSGIVDFRADLAGLLAVTIVASYESCVKETLLKLSGSHHPKFAEYVARKYERLNSKIGIDDLNGYCRVFDPNTHDRFRNQLKRRKDKIQKYLGNDIHQAYGQMLAWRHDFAHSAKRNTTVEEVIQFHRLAKHVLFAFYDALI